MRPEDIFNSIFGNFGLGGFPFSDMNANMNPNMKSGKTQDIVHTISVPLSEFYSGSTRKLEFNQRIICYTCNGSGSSKPGADTTCKTCNGSGIEKRMRKMGPMIQQIQSQCSACNGEGIVIPKADRCSTCNGKFVITRPKQLEIKIRPGMHNGEQIVFKRESHQSPGATSGDVVVILQEIPSAGFVRLGNDLLYNCNINLSESLGGLSISIETLDKRTLNLRTDTKGNIISNGSTKVVKGEGMPYFHSPSQKGNLYIKFNVTTPNAVFLDEELMKILQVKFGEKRRITSSAGKDVILSESATPPHFESIRREEERRDEEQKAKKRKHREEEGAVNCTHQ
jgi:DnaJ family protein A protein 2